MELEKIKAFIINCRTGCTCCSYENFSEGFFKTQEDAERRIKRYLSGKDYPLASQFAKYGTYNVEEVILEDLKDGRFIVDNRIVIFDIFIVETNEDGSYKDKEAKNLGDF